MQSAYSVLCSSVDYAISLIVIVLVLVVMTLVVTIAGWMDDLEVLRRVECGGYPAVRYMQSAYPDLCSSVDYALSLIVLVMVLVVMTLVVTIDGWMDERLDGGPVSLTGD